MKISQRVLRTLRRNLPIGLAIAILITVPMMASLLGKYTTTQEVTKIDINVYAAGGVALDLCEGADLNKEWAASAHDLTLLPGASLTFNPYVCVERGSKSCYVYVKIDASNTDSILTYSIRTGAGAWTQGDGTSIPENVYYCKVERNQTNHTYLPIIQNDEVTVSATAAQIKALTDATVPSITITVYGVEISTTENTTAPETAWAKISSAT